MGLSELNYIDVFLRNLRFSATRNTNSSKEKTIKWKSYTSTGE